VLRIRIVLEAAQAQLARSAMYRSPEEIAQQFQALGAVGAGYILINGGTRGRREPQTIMPHFAHTAPQRTAAAMA